MVTVRVKFRVEAKTQRIYAKINSAGLREQHRRVSVELSPVYDVDPSSENRQFWDSTPIGKVELNCISEAAADQFELGREYYIDFTLAL